MISPEVLYAKTRHERPLSATQSATRKRDSMAGFKGNGEGSIYQRSVDDLWLGVQTVGRDSNGRLVRKTVTAKTRAEVVRKLKRLQRQLDDGLPAPDTMLTVAQLLNRWHDDALRHHVAPSAAHNYKAIADHQLIDLPDEKPFNARSPSWSDEPCRPCRR
jgi:hypothetical protein